jgi:hypothetical protein
MKGFEKMADDAGENENIRLQNEESEVNEGKPLGEDSILLVYAYSILGEDDIKVEQFSAATYTAYRFHSMHGMTVYVRLDKVSGKPFQHCIFITIGELKFSITSGDDDGLKSQIEAIYEKARNLCARKINIAYEARLRMYLKTL